MIASDFVTVFPRSVMIGDLPSGWTASNYSSALFDCASRL
jgi:predicted DNA-binding transcriptional regulator AlpA